MSKKYCVECQTFKEKYKTIKIKPNEKCPIDGCVANLSFKISIFHEHNLCNLCQKIYQKRNINIQFS